MMKLSFIAKMMIFYMSNHKISWWEGFMCKIYIWMLRYKVIKGMFYSVTFIRLVSCILLNRSALPIIDAKKVAQYGESVYNAVRSFEARDK